MSTAVATTAAMPIGTFNTKIHRHDSWTSRPPTTGPAAAPRDPLTAHHRIDSSRRSAAIAVRIKPRLVGTSAAAPTACNPRKPTITHRLLLSAQPRLASEKIASPVMNAGLLPYRSARRPTGTRSAANTMAYPFSTQLRFANDCSSTLSPMARSPTLTMNRSRALMNVAAHRIRSSTFGLTARARCMRSRFGFRMSGEAGTVAV